MTKRPSRDQSSGQPAGAPILTSNCSGPAPFADLTYRSNAPLRFEAHTTRRPSGGPHGRIVDRGIEGKPGSDAANRIQNPDISVVARRIGEYDAPFVRR